jgi:hypothetical protein
MVSWNLRRTGLSRAALQRAARSANMQPCLAEEVTSRPPQGESRRDVRHSQRGGRCNSGLGAQRLCARDHSITKLRTRLWFGGFVFLCVGTP